MKLTKKEVDLLLVALESHIDRLWALEANAEADLRPLEAIRNRSTYQECEVLTDKLLDMIANRVVAKRKAG